MKPVDALPLHGFVPPPRAQQSTSTGKAAVVDDDLLPCRQAPIYMQSIVIGGALFDEGRMNLQEL